MKLDEFIDGLAILRRYFDKDGYHIGAEHDIFYVYKTDRPMSFADATAMQELGWHQPEAEDGPYDPDEGWAAFT
jgi:hypothetical protein